MKRLIVILLAASLLPAAASAQTIMRKSGPTDRTPSPEGARVYFAELKDGDTVEKTFRVKFRVDGMYVRRAGNNVANSGHHHLLIDVKNLPPLDEPLPQTESVHHFDKSQKQAVITMPPGEHTMQLIFADYRHVPHDPPVMSEVITVIVEE